MKSIQLIPSFLTLMLGVFGTSPLLAQTAPKKHHRMEVRIDKSNKTKEKADASMPSVFKHLPESVVIVGQAGLLLSLGPSATASSQLTLQIGGASRCLRVFGRTKGGDTVPMEFGIVKKGEMDPCTGKAPVSPALDLTGSVPTSQAKDRHYRLYSCKGPGKCFWYTLTVRRAGGIP